MKTISSFFLVLFMIVASFFAGLKETSADLSVNVNCSEKIILTEENKELLTAIFETETAWLASLQLENGAIPMTSNKNGEVSLSPYFSDFAALALLDNADKYSENVKRYMEWHFSHLNTEKTDYNGIACTIYDYTVTLENGAVIKEVITVKDGKNSYDSTDSYAATFLMLLDKYFNMTGDSEYILSKADEISGITEVMFSTLNKGLTYAKPDYQVKYLMDNCEVYAGIIAAYNLFNNVICKENSSYWMMRWKCCNAIDWISQNIESKLWNAEKEHYVSGVFRDGTAAFDFSWEEFYPSSTAQLFPIVHGVIPADSIRAKNLYNEFCANYNWENFDIPDAFYWGNNVYAAVIMNDTERVITYMENYSSLLSDHAYPLYNADAAKVSMAAFKLLEKAK